MSSSEGHILITTDVSCSIACCNLWKRSQKSGVVRRLNCLDVYGQMRIFKLNANRLN